MEKLGAKEGLSTEGGRGVKEGRTQKLGSPSSGGNRQACPSEQMPEWRPISHQKSHRRWRELWKVSLLSPFSLNSKPASPTGHSPTPWSWGKVTH